VIKENVVIKWVHRFGIDSLNDLLIHSSLQKENQEHISLIDEVQEENQEQIKLELSKTFENIEETKWESNGLETSSSNEISSKNQNSFLSSSYDYANICCVIFRNKFRA